jgi:hypothetical protein
MIPFSFLLDYVFQVAKALRWSEKDKNLDLTVVRYAESHLRYSAKTIGFRATDTVGTVGYVIDGKYYNYGKYRPYIGYRSSSYTRLLCEPQKFGLVLPRWKAPTVHQWQNVAALAKVLLFR